MNVLLLKAWIAEEGPALIGSRLRSVRQLDERSLLLDLVSEAGPRTLLLSVLEEYPVLALVSGDEYNDSANVIEGNFAKALNFHLAGYTLYSIAQDGFDRSVVFRFYTRDLYGKDTLKRLRHELAGRASNAFLLSDRDMVVSIMKRVRHSQNRVRHVLTGKTLPPPPPLGKYLAVETGVEGLASELAELAGLEGIEDQASLEQLFSKRVAGCDVKLWPALEPLLPVSYDLESLYQFILQLQNGEFTAALFGLGQEGLSANEVALAGWLAASRKRGAAPAKTDPRRLRLLNRLDQLRLQYTQTARADELEQLGLELLGRAAAADSAGSAGAVLTAWADEHTDWAQYLDLNHSVYDNAQDLVRQAQRLKRGREKLELSLHDVEDELEQLEQSAPIATKSARQQRDELKLAKLGIKCHRFTSSDGLAIYCGTNDASNDALLRSFNAARHLWLHARDFPGSHVFVIDAAKNTPWNTLLEAAAVAAYHSQGRREAELDVSYTPANQIRRVRDGKPGQVLKLSEKIVRVSPDEFERLKPQLLKERIKPG